MRNGYKATANNNKPYSSFFSLSLITDYPLRITVFEMSRIIFDIETFGMDFGSLDPATQEYFLKWADTEDEVQRIKESLSFYPLTAEVITIGMLNPDTGKGAVYFQTPGDTLLPFEEDGIRYECGTE